MKPTKNLINLTILALTLISILSTIAYAKPFTDAFKGGLTQINDFFVNEQYAVTKYSNILSFLIY